MESTGGRELALTIAVVASGLAAGSAEASIIAGHVIDVDAVRVDGEINSDGYREHEFDFGADYAVPRCQRRTENITTCAPGRGDWLPKGQATMTYWDDGRVRASLFGKLSYHGRGSYAYEYAADPEICLYQVRVRFHYADGGSGWVESECGEDDISLTSPADRDVVRAEIRGPGPKTTGRLVVSLCCG